MPGLGSMSPRLLSPALPPVIRYTHPSPFHKRVERRAKDRYSMCYVRESLCALAADTSHCDYKPRKARLAEEAPAPTPSRPARPVPAALFRLMAAAHSHALLKSKRRED